MSPSEETSNCRGWAGSYCLHLRTFVFISLICFKICVMHVFVYLCFFDYSTPLVYDMYYPLIVTFVNHPCTIDLQLAVCMLNAILETSDTAQGTSWKMDCGGAISAGLSTCGDPGIIVGKAVGGRTGATTCASPG